MSITSRRYSIVVILIVLGISAFLVFKVAQQLPAVLSSMASSSNTMTSTNTLFATQLKTYNGRTIRVRKLSNKEVSSLKTPAGISFEDEKADEGLPANADIYVDQEGEYWVLPPGAKYAQEFP